MTIVRGSDDAAFRDETDKLKQERLAKEADDRSSRTKNYAWAICAMLVQALLVMWIWNDLQPFNAPKMNFIHAIALVFVLKWIVLQKLEFPGSHK